MRSSLFHPRKRSVLLVWVGFALALAARLSADVRCAVPFGDHMVLQRDRPVPVWGEAAPGERVTVSFAGQSQTTATGADGHWSVHLEPLRASSESRPLTVTGTNTVTFQDVVVGEVWLGSGQSNMEKPLGLMHGQKPTDNYEAEIAQGDHPQLRIFQMPPKGKLKEGSANQRWWRSSPESLKSTNFSAAAYYFGRDLNAALGVPVGVIHSSFGGTQIEAWIPAPAFARDPELAPLLKVHYFAWTSGVQAAELYHSMIEPLVPFAVRGFLWYQGEANVMQADGPIYTSKMRALIEGWRAAWHEPDAPFDYVELAPFDYSKWESFPKKLTREALPRFWEAQTAALAIPHTDLIVTTDLVTNFHDIHPTHKRAVGGRLANLVLADTYGRTDLVAKSPRYAAMNLRPDGSVELRFDETGTGLRSRDGKPLDGFTIAGEDHRFVPASARIRGATVIVSSGDVPHPAAVRFAWEETAHPNLVNSAGLPAVPFRTDAWPVVLERPAAPKPASAPATGGHNTAAGLKMLPIAAGSFTMGETEATPESLGGPPVSRKGDWDEQPVHHVTLTHPFLISETPVTAEAYRRFRPDYKEPEFFSPYATGISWNDAVAYCRWLSAQEHRNYRLPTEAEWEYAARAGTTGLFASGDAPPDSPDAANAWGLKGIGNGIAEWTQDWHGPYSSADQSDPVGPASGLNRVIRNGGIAVEKHSPKQPKAPEMGFRPSGYLAIPAYYRRSANRASLPPEAANTADTVVHFVGFRLVEAAAPVTAPTPTARSFPLDGVLPAVTTPPLPDRPYFKVRTLWPIPPEDENPDAIAAAGLLPAVMGHLHSAGLAVMPNGDLLQVSFSSAIGESEDSPDSTMVVTRLRRGANEWDFPDLFYDMADENDQSALLWNDQGKVWFFGGGRAFGQVPFRFLTSDDSGAHWSTIHIPRITHRAGFVQSQPITSAFRKDGAIFFGSDGQGGSSLLWTSPDNGATWADTGGRTAGRHTTFVVLNDGRILAMGGKSTSIGGYMPRTFSSDNGRTWAKAEATPFPALGSNQRPVILRLKSGRLFFAGDFQLNSGQAPAGVHEHGSYVALSGDEGKTWQIKRLALARPHAGKAGALGYSTLGYCIAAQAPDGLIHLTTSMTHPAQHFAMNEAWIQSKLEGEANADPAGDGAGAPETHEERYSDGTLRAVWHSRMGANGEYVLDGTEIWYLPGGQKHYEVTYRFGRKVGEETRWLENGGIDWQWERPETGAATWTRYWDNGHKRSESHWRGLKAEGPATSWAPDGTVTARVAFVDGAPAK